MVSAFARSVAAHVKALAEPNAAVWDPEDAKVSNETTSRGCEVSYCATFAGWDPEDAKVRLTALAGQPQQATHLHSCAAACIWKAGLRWHAAS